MHTSRRGHYTSSPGKTIPVAAWPGGRGAKVPDYLVVSAWAPELTELQNGLPSLPARVRRKLALGTVGVGLVDAALGATSLLDALHPRAMIFVGTAGLYPGSPGHLRIGDAAVASEIVLFPEAVARGDAYLPRAMVGRETPTSSLGRAIGRVARIESASVACPLAITTTDGAATLARRKTRCALEHLEAFSVARAAANAKIPFAAVLGIANHVGAQGHREWKRNGGTAAAAACRAVAEYLSREGLPPTRGTARR